MKMKIVISTDNVKMSQIRSIEKREPRRFLLALSGALKCKKGKILSGHAKFAANERVEPA